jgi:polyhydroxybutyrate depolymerase
MKRTAIVGVILSCSALVFGCGSDSTTAGFSELTTSGSPSGGSGGMAAATAGSGSNSSGNGGSGGGDSMASSGSGNSGPIGGDRPVEVHVPPGYDPSVPTPLVILLHGYSANGQLQEFYLDLSKEADVRGYLFATPSGTKDKQGLNFWNATEACCNLNDIDIDDSAYLRKLVEDIEGGFNVDPRRIYFAGHSNGGFMSHRMACEHADKIAAIASLAGATHDDPAKCKPSEPVATLNIHGTLDPIILYGGGYLVGNPYPGVIETSTRWAVYNGCSTAPDKTPQSINIEALILGKETKVRRYDIGCDPGGMVELWSIQAAGHLPIFNGSFRKKVFDFFEAHPKP